MRVVLSCNFWPTERPFFEASFEFCKHGVKRSVQGLLEPMEQSCKHYEEGEEAVFCNQAYNSS